MSPARWDALRAELLRWIGTRFWSGMGAQARPGVGADCVSFIAGAYQSAGIISPVCWPPYVTHGGGEAMLERMLGVLSGLPELRRVWFRPDGGPVPALEPGDILVISSGKALHHLAAYIGDNSIVHCLDNFGVCRGSVQESVIARHLWALYRPDHVSEVDLHQPPGQLEPVRRPVDHVQGPGPVSG